MVTARPSVLVIGAEGMIGAALSARLRNGGARVHATCRDPSPASLALDVARPGDWPALPKVDAAVICAAVASLGDCERDPAGSRRVNVDGAVEIARRLAGRGVFTLFLSSDKVFDGALPRRRHGDRPSPVTEYGRQKTEAEARLLKLGDRVGILRLTKVLTPGSGLTAEWRTRLAAGAPIVPYQDMVFAPVSARLAVDTILRIVTEGRSGIHHLSGAEDRTYADFARGLAEFLGADTDLVRPVPAPAGPVRPPRFTTLDMTPETARWGVRPPSLEETTRELLGDPP